MDAAHLCFWNSGNLKPKTKQEYLEYKSVLLNMFIEFLSVGQIFPTLWGPFQVNLSMGQNTQKRFNTCVVFTVFLGGLTGCRLPQYPFWGHNWWRCLQLKLLKAGRCLTKNRNHAGCWLYGRRSTCQDSNKPNKGG